MIINLGNILHSLNICFQFFLLCEGWSNLQRAYDNVCEFKHVLRDMFICQEIKIKLICERKTYNKTWNGIAHIIWYKKALLLLAKKQRKKSIILCISWITWIFVYNFLNDLLFSCITSLATPTHCRSVRFKD